MHEYFCRVDAYLLTATTHAVSIGFRIPKNVKAALQGEVSFLGRIFGFQPFDAVPIEIENEEAIGK